MKKLLILSAFLGFGFFAANAQSNAPASANTPKAEVAAPAPTDKAGTDKKDEKKACSAEEKKSCETKGKSCCSSKKAAAAPPAAPATPAPATPPATPKRK